MLKNALYDLTTQLTQESKSLWRIENEYIQNAAGNHELLDFWTNMKKDKQEHVERLKELVKKGLE